MVKQNLDCEIHGPTTPEGPQAVQNIQKSQIFKNLYLYSHICGEETKRMVLMFMKPSTKIVKFMVPESGVQVIRWGQYGYKVKI